MTTQDKRKYKFTFIGLSLTLLVCVSVALTTEPLLPLLKPALGAKLMVLSFFLPIAGWRYDTHRLTKEDN